MLAPQMTGSGGEGARPPPGPLDGIGGEVQRAGSLCLPGREAACRVRLAGSPVLR